MTSRLSVERLGEGAELVGLDGPVSVGGGERDRPRIAGLPPGALLVSPAPDGLVIQANAPGVRIGAVALDVGRRRLLQPGEQAELGDVLLRCESGPPLEGTRALAGALLRAGLPTAADVPHLLVVQGASAGSRLALRDGAVVGRGEEAGLRIDDVRASRRHARFTLRAGRACCEDLSSKNGVLVNGRLARRGRARLRPGDALTLGETLLVFRDGAHARAARAPVSDLARGTLERRPRRKRAAIALGVASGALLLTAALLLAAA